MHGGLGQEGPHKDIEKRVNRVFRFARFYIPHPNDELYREPSLSVIENPESSAKKQKEVAAGTCPGLPVNFLGGDSK